jgi:hypothetical protein
MSNKEWDNEPETLRHLWLKQCDACWRFSCFDSEAYVLLYKMDAAALQVEADEALTLVKKWKEEVVPRRFEDLEVTKQAKKNYESAGGDYKSD